MLSVIVVNHEHLTLLELHLERLHRFIDIPICLHDSWQSWHRQDTLYICIDKATYVSILITESKWLDRFCSE